MKTFDLELLKEQCGEDRSFYNDMIRIFISSTGEGIEEMEKALKQNDLQTVSHQAHKIISPCRHINAKSMVEKLAKIENIAKGKERKPEELGGLINEIRSDFKELSIDLKKEIS